MPCCRQERLCDLMQFACGQRFRVCTAYAFYHLLFSVVRVLVHFTFSVLICCIDISALLQNSVQHYTTLVKDLMVTFTCHLTFIHYHLLKSK